MRRTTIVVAAAVFLCLIGGGSALATTASLYFQGPAPGDPYYGGGYAGPYQFSINGGPLVSMICDDYSDEVLPGESWIANVYSGTNVSQAKWSASTAYSSTHYGLTAQQAYDVMFYLTSEIMSSTGQTQAEYQGALWGLETPSAINGDGTAQAYINSAITTVEGWTTSYAQSFAANFTVYDWNGDPSTVKGANPPPQEYIRENVPESSSLLFLGASLLMIAGAVSLKVRRART